MSETPYNPLEKLRLGESVARALLSRDSAPLPPPKAFGGAGIYAIYYFGSLPLYAELTKSRPSSAKSRPIYVGKAVPPGSRKGGYGLGLRAGQVLYDRLRQHAASIRQASSLVLDDFACRYLVTDDIWIPLAEALLIERFKPVWNVLIDGFGIHDPGKGRKDQQRSRWDMLHPGRRFAEKRPPNAASVREISALVRRFLVGEDVPTIPTAQAVEED